MIQVEGIFAGRGKSKYKPYLTFISPYAFTVSVSTPGWDGTMEYSTDSKAWMVWDGSAITSAVGVNDDAGYYVLYLRGTGNTKVSWASSTATKSNFVIDGQSVSCIGNIETLLDYPTVERGLHPPMSSAYCFGYLFYNCSALVIPPSLPSTELTNFCYFGLFRGTNIVVAPELPAKNTAIGCYQTMFRDCKQLIALPALLSDTVVASAYENMFRGCTKIKLATAQDTEYTYPYRIPFSGDGSEDDSMANMFTDTGGTFAGTPTINTTYYVSNTNIVV